MASVNLAPPSWMPPAGTVDAVSAGDVWDAVVVQQHIGIAALEHLDRETARRPGPIIWDPTLRAPRIYFLVPTGTDALMWRHERLLAAGAHIVIPGATTIAPPGPYWLVPPDPDAPLTLVDPALLRRALDRVRTDAAGEYCPTDGRSQRMLVTSAQLNGRACIVCGLEVEGMVAAGYVLTPPDGSARLPWPVRACPAHSDSAEVAR